MFKRLQKYVPKDVTGAFKDAQAAFSNLTGQAEDGKSSAVATESGGGATASSPQAGSDDEGDSIFEIGEEDVLAPLFEPFAYEVPLFDASPVASPEGVAADAGPEPKAVSAAARQRAAEATELEASLAELFDRGQLGAGPIAAILVVDFHHVHGPVVEWSHPPLLASTSFESSRGRGADGARIVARTTEEVEAFPYLDIWARRSTAAPLNFEQAQSLIAFLALPDGTHHAKSDETSTVFFVLPMDGNLFYGISCHRRVGSADLLHRDESVSRSAVQKAVCVLSRCPFFGLIQERLSPVTQAFFEQKDFRSTTLLSGFYDQLNSVPFEKLSESELLLGLDHAPVFRALKHELLAVLKAILLEAKVLVYSMSAELCSRTVLCLLSLLPGAAWLAFNSNGLGSRHYHFRKYGLPLQCFGPRCCVYPYLGLQMLDALLQMRGFLVGTTNRMLVERASPDVLLEVQTDAETGAVCYSLSFANKELKQVVKCSAQDKSWLQDSLSVLEAAAPKPQQPQQQPHRQPSQPSHPSQQQRQQQQPPPTPPPPLLPQHELQQEPEEQQQDQAGPAVAPIAPSAAAEPLSAAAPVEASSPEASTRAELDSSPELVIPSGVQTFTIADADDEVRDIEDAEFASPRSRGSRSPRSPHKVRGSSRSGEGSGAAGEGVGLDRKSGRGGAPDPIDWMLGRHTPRAFQLAPSPNFGLSAEALFGAWGSSEPSVAVDQGARASLRLFQEASWSAVVDTSRAAFASYWDRLLAQVAAAAGPERELQRGLEFASRETKHELGRYGLSFLQRWLQHTTSGQAWLKAHRLPVPERRPRPPQEGLGVYRFTNGDEYRGQFRKGVRHGQGVYVSSKRRFHYDGQWHKDRRTGAGTLTVESAQGQVVYTYDGEWLNDERQSQGSCVYRGRDKYSGQWAKNQYHGAGTLVDSQGALYEGEWEAGKFHGVGKYTQKGETYTGEFVNGERHGKGQLARTGGPDAGTDGEAALIVDLALGGECLFAGEFRAGKRHGHGRAIYEHGEYEGNWVEGQRHGQGSVSHGANQLEGPWVANQPDPDGMHLLFYSNGAKYTGRIHCRAPVPQHSGDRGSSSSSSSIPVLRVGAEGVAEAAAWWAFPEGRGLMKSPDGRVFDGMHAKGLPHGHGIAFGTDRSKYEGQFESGERHGEGFMSRPGATEAQAVRYEHGRLLLGPAEGAQPSQADEGDDSARPPDTAEKSTDLDPSQVAERPSEEASTCHASPASSVGEAAVVEGAEGNNGPLPTLQPAVPPPPLPPPPFDPPDRLCTPEAATDRGAELDAAAGDGVE